MQQQFHFLHLDYSQSLCDYTSEQLERAGRYLLKESESQVYFSKVKKNFCHVEIHVQSAWGHFQASSSGDDFYQVVDEATHKLERQFKKEKEKLQKHRKSA